MSSVLISIIILWFHNTRHSSQYPLKVTHNSGNCSCNTSFCKHPSFFVISPAPFQAASQAACEFAFHNWKAVQYHLVPAPLLSFSRRPRELDRIMYSGAGYRVSHSRPVTDKKNVAGNELFATGSFII